MNVVKTEARTRAVLRSAAPVRQAGGIRRTATLGSLPRVARLPGRAQEAAAIKPNLTRYAKSETAHYEE